MNIRGEEPITSCDALEVTFHDYEETVTAEETLQIAGTRLAVDTRNDGVQVIGWDGAGFSVTLCKALGLTNAGRTATLLESIRIVRNGDRISVAGPKNGDWVGYLIVRAPREATMDLAARNGPIDLANVSGRFTAKATNGPIGIRDASGEFRIETENGPISVARSRGDFTLDAQNGPINVKLGDAWEGKGLVARAVNGPLTVRVSPSFRSGLVVETDRHTPFDCDGPICRGARVDLDHARRFELGGAA
ncbi:MAG TPA: hypothetical protein VIL97_03880, partial [Thermoanaerobaculia bacterium]